MRTLLRAPIQIEQLGETGLRIRRSVKNGSWHGFCEVMFTGATRIDKADHHSETYFFGPGFITTSGYEFTSIDDGRQRPDVLGGHSVRSRDYARDKALGNLFFRDILKLPHRRGLLHSHEQRVHQFGGGPRYRGC